jgi:dTDP-4-dehydrorhamnose reductase
MKILVTGAAGQLGGAIVQRYSSRADVMAVKRADLDVADTAAIEPFVVRHAPDVVINCAAYNNVDGAEDDPLAALRVNALGVKALAGAAAAADAAFVHYGTDFVFDGVVDRAWSEEDEPSPQSVYAASKLLGEWFAADVRRHYVLRVESLFGGAARRSTVDRIAAAIRAGEPARVFVDRTVTPSFVDDVADATWALLEAHAPSGVYHSVNSGTTTWFELAREIGRVLGIEPELIATKVADVPMRAKRPQYAALDNAKLARAGVPMPMWQNALKRYLA